MEDLDKLSGTALEISFNLLLDYFYEDVPLIKALDVFIYKLNDDYNPYMINIIMEMADTDLKKMMKSQNQKQMDFFNLF